MEEEVLLNSNRAKTHKKIAYSTPSCANRKLRSPSRGKYTDKKLFSESLSYSKISQLLFYINFYFYRKPHFANFVNKISLKIIDVPIKK